MWAAPCRYSFFPQAFYVSEHSRLEEEQTTVIGYGECSAQREWYLHLELSKLRSCNPILPMFSSSEAPYMTSEYVKSSSTAGRIS